MPPRRRAQSRIGRRDNELEDHLRVRRESVVAGTSSPSAFAVFRFIGCRRDRPLAHPGGSGLLWAIQGGRLVELHRDWAAPLMREHISDDGLRSLVDMDMLH